MMFSKGFVKSGLLTYHFAYAGKTNKSLPEWMLATKTDLI